MKFKFKPQNYTSRNTKLNKETIQMNVASISTSNSGRQAEK